MSQAEGSRRTGRPHNPGVRELVAGKRRWSSPPRREHAVLGFRGWHERGYLPHRDEPGLTQFVTFHLADSLPASLRHEWAALLEIEDDRRRRESYEAYLDKCRGECVLRQSEIGALVDRAIRFYNVRYYELRAWVVMPNHVHLLFKTGTTPMSRILSQLKEYTAREANKLLSTRGQFWAEDYFDVFMRDGAHEQRSRRYIENNPAKAHLVLDPKEWPWTSARHRDAFGELRL